MTLMVRAVQITARFFTKNSTIVPTPVLVKKAGMPQPPARSFSAKVPCGVNSSSNSPGERCASTSNRNFEGRQGNGGRTHLVSPAMAAAAALEGHFVDVRKIA
jgi:hypothetical protein